MPVSMEDARQGTIRGALCEDVESQLLKVLNDSNLTLRELIYTLAMISIDVGSSLEGIKEKLDYDTMWRRYAVTPTLGNALMSSGADMLSEWLKVKEDKDA